MKRCGELGAVRATRSPRSRRCTAAAPPLRPSRAPSRRETLTSASPDSGDSMTSTQALRPSAPVPSVGDDSEDRYSAIGKDPRGLQPGDAVEADDDGGGGGLVGRVSLVQASHRPPRPRSSPGCAPGRRCGPPSRCAGRRPPACPLRAATAQASPPSPGPRPASAGWPGSPSRSPSRAAGRRCSRGTGSGRRPAASSSPVALPLLEEALDLGRASCPWSGSGWHPHRPRRRRRRARSRPRRRDPRSAPPPGRSARTAVDSWAAFAARESASLLGVSTSSRLRLPLVEAVALREQVVLDADRRHPGPVELHQRCAPRC